MAQIMPTNSLVCEVCDMKLHPHSFQQHVDGKKHKAKQEQYNKKYKTIFVTGISKFSAKDLENIFKKYGEIDKVQKQKIKPFAFIQFVEKDSVERVLGARVFAGGKRLFVHRYKDNRIGPYHEEDKKEKSRKLSETLSNTSQAEGVEGEGPRVGVKELPIQIAEPDCWDHEDVVLWQAVNFVSQVELSTEMYHSLNEVKFDVENLFRPLLPGCQVIVFGSCGSTLAFKNSDVDLFLRMPDGEQPMEFVRREAKEMYRSRLFRVITRIPGARVPIVKFEHLRTGWQGDLTANSQLGVCNSQLIRFLVSLDPRIKPLTMVIKYWSKVCEVTGNHTRFTTYSLVMLVIFYLQQLDPPMLPIITQLQQMCQQKKYSLGWECSFCDEDWRVQSECLPQTHKSSLRELLTGFFRFYHNFDFSNVICPLLGRTVPVEDFESNDGSDLPEEMFLYREKLKNDPSCKFKTNVNFRVQDPFELCLNITRNVAEKTFLVFKEACKVSLELCEKEEDAVLLKSLFSINAESLDVGEDCVKFKIKFMGETSDSPEDPESSITQWYQVTIESIMLVLKQIFKFNVDQHSGEMSSKVKKLESSQDVHTPVINHNGNDLVFVCSGKANVWDSRKKTRRFMNSLNISLNPFEKEVCMSNALYYPSDEKLFYFTLTISSLEDFKKGGKGIKVQINTKKSLRHPLIKGFIHFIKTEFRDFVFKARSFINKVESSSPLTEVKESLKELFDLKLENLPDLKELMKKKNELMSGKIKDDTVVEKQKVISRVLDKGNESSDNESKTTGGKVEQIRPSSSKEISGNSDDEVTKYVMPSTDLSNAQKQILIDEFFKPTSPKQIYELKNSSEGSENIEVNKLNDILNAIQKIETQSTFTSVKINPFLASIEKVALSVESEAQVVENEEELNVNEEKEAGSVGPPLNEEHKSKAQGEAPSNPYEEIEANVKSECDEGKTSELTESLPSSSQEKIDENNIIKVGTTDSSLNKTKGDQKICLQRPKIYSERPLKQKKPNTNRFNKNPVQKPNQRSKGSPWQPWAGGGPPGCQSWQSHFPSSQDFLDHERGERHPSNRNIQRQKKCYPGLFRDSDC